MRFLYPVVLAVAVVLSVGAVAGYVALQRRRSAALAAAGFGSLSGGRLRRHLPYALLLAALPVLLAGLARPEADLAVPRVSGTVLLAFDSSNSMKATDVAPNRLAAAQAAATTFVEAQPDSVDVGVLAFGDQALLTQAPSDDHAAAIAAIGRLKTGGGTSIGQAILVGLSTITGKQVTLPFEGDVGYWPSATIVLFSDGQETGGADVEAAAELAAKAGVRVQTVGIGTERGGTVEVDGYQLGTALEEPVLTALARTTGGQYRRAADAGTLADATDAIDLRLTSTKEPVELTGPFAAAALLLLAAGALLSLRWHGRLV